MKKKIFYKFFFKPFLLAILFLFFSINYSKSYNLNNNDNINSIVKNDFYYEIIQSSWHKDKHKEKAKKKKEESKRKKKETDRKVKIIKDFINNEDFKICLKELVIGSRYNIDEANKIIDKSIDGNSIYINKLSEFNIESCISTIRDKL